jgi:hypothetical protein
MILIVIDDSHLGEVNHANEDEQYCWWAILSLIYETSERSQATYLGVRV